MSQITERRWNPGQNFESRDSIGIAKLVEGQLKGVMQLIKDRGLLKESPPEPNGTRGIVIAGGGKYAEWSLVNAKWIRHQGIGHPIQLWHLGPREIPDWMRPEFAKLDVELVDAHEVRHRHWIRKLGGWELKQYAAARCSFDDVCFVDADCLLISDPAIVWDSAEYQERPALFFSDVNKCAKSSWHYMYAGVPIPEAEVESGVFFWNRRAGWEGIKMVLWILEHSELWFRICWGDKETLYLGFESTKTPYIQSSERAWKGWGIEQSWNGNVIANHAMAYKRGEHKPPSALVEGFFDEVRSLRP